MMQTKLRFTFILALAFFDWSAPRVSAQATATLSVTKPVAYESNPRNVGQFRVNLSPPNSSPTAVGFAISGTAKSGLDYVAITNSVTIASGATNAFVNIVAVDNTVLDADRTVLMTLLAGNGYVLGTATEGTVTIRNDDLSPGITLYSENFDTDVTAAWTVNQGPGDGIAEFFFDYGTVGIPSAPHSTGGSTRGLKLQANVSSGVFGGLSVSPTGKEFTGDYWLRFDMWLNYNGPLGAGGNGSTQVTGAGVGSSGAAPQWAGGSQESVWFGVTGEGGSTVDYRAYSSASGSGYVESSGVFAAGTATGARNNTNPYYAQFGGESAPEAQLAAFPAQTGTTPVGGTGFQWRDVVIKKLGNQISFAIDGLLIATVDATDVRIGGGNILFNHFDINATSSTDPNAASLLFGLIDNVRVEGLTAPAQILKITGIKVTGGKIQIGFIAGANDAPTAFKLQSSATLLDFANEAGATITQIAGGSFQAELPANGTFRFYRILR